MNYIGVDMSKALFHAAMNESKVLEFANDITGYKQFTNNLQHQGYTKTKTIIGLESTGVYHIPLCIVLSEAGWKVRIINPLVVNKIARTKLRLVKTDKKDALLIRKVLMSGEGYLFCETKETQQLKSLVMERSGLVMIRASIKRRQEAKSWRDKCQDNSSGGLERVLQAVSNEIMQIEQHIQETETDDQKLLRTIPGIGLVSAASLVADIGSITRFKGPKQLVAYLGLDCRIYESGTSVRGKSYITKRGNKRLRTVLFSATVIAKRYIPELKAYYEKKLNEGHHHFAALCATERKLVNIIYAVWKRGTPFEQH